MAHGTFSRTGFLTSRATGILALSNAIVMFGFGQILPLVPLLLYNVLGASELEVYAPDHTTRDSIAEALSF